MKIKVKAEIKHAGKIVTEIYEVEEKYAESQEFLWTEGNYSCDCNRSIFFFELNVDDCWPCNLENNLFELVSLEVGGEKIKL